MFEQYLHQSVMASKFANDFHQRLIEEGIEVGEGIDHDAIYTYSNEESATVLRLFKEMIKDVQ